MVCLTILCINTLYAAHAHTELTHQLMHKIAHNCVRRSWISAGPWTLLTNCRRINN
jgi:hypothetical protein